MVEDTIMTPAALTRLSCLIGEPGNDASGMFTFTGKSVRKESSRNSFMMSETGSEGDFVTSGFGLIVDKPLLS